MARGGEGRHPIGVVVQRTGLSPHVLRAWERRYGAVEPGRTEGGQRLYSDADVVRLGLLKRATEGGRSIGSVAGLPLEELVSLVGEDAGAVIGEWGVGGEGEGGWRVEGYLESCIAAAEAMDTGALRSALMRAVVRLDVTTFVGAVVAPLLERVGSLWEAGSLRPAQEHVVSTAVRRVLDWLLGEFDAGVSAPLAMMGTPSGESHEFGAMLASVVAADAGWRVLYLGPSLPAEEIAGAATRAGASVVGLSVVVLSRGEAVEQLAEVRRRLPAGVPVLVGGRSSGRCAVAGVTRVPDLAALREVLRSAEGGRA